MLLLFTLADEAAEGAMATTPLLGCQNCLLGCWRQWWRLPSLVVCGAISLDPQPQTLRVLVASNGFRGEKKGLRDDHNADEWASASAESRSTFHSVARIQFQPRSWFVSAFVCACGRVVFVEQTTDR